MRTNLIDVHPFYGAKLFDMWLDPIENNKLQLDVIRTDKKLIIEYSVPGIEKEDINVEIEKNSLNVKVERKERKDFESKRTEIFSGTFERSLVLPDFVDKDSVKVTLHNGILSVEFNKIDKTNDKRKIEIK